MKIKLFLILIVLLVGCDDTENATCDESTADARESFIAGCIVSQTTTTIEETQAATEFCRVQSIIHYCKE